MIDSHCHLADEAFAGDLAEVVSRARETGLTAVLCVLDASDHAELARGVQVASAWDAIRTTAGVHPHRAGAYAADPSDAARVVRERLATDSRVCAIGEIGLDYHYLFAPPHIQQHVLATQIELATEASLPVVLHTREADEDTLRLLRAHGRGVVRGVFHCFSGDVALAREALDLGFYVSFSGIVTFPKAGSVHEAARFVPDDRLLVETDSPYLAPVPNRGRRNEPAWVRHVIDRLAALRRSRPSRVAEISSENFGALFGSVAPPGSRMAGEVSAR
ncbi:MAG: TatD family hydrolase [Acidobacteriota bacterium]